MLAGIAQATSRVTIGPLVAATSFHAPAMLAKQAATVDEISGGPPGPRPGRGLERDGVPRLRLPVRSSDQPIRGGVHDHPDAPARRARSTSTAPSTRLATASCCRARRGPAGHPSCSARAARGCSGIAAPWIDAWNAWYNATGNRPAGDRSAPSAVDAAAQRGGTGAGRHPADGGGPGPAAAEAPAASRAATRRAEITALAGPPEVIAEGLRAYARAGIDEVQLVLDPITLGSIEAARAGARAA